MQKYFKEKLCLVSYQTEIPNILILNQDNCSHLNSAVFFLDVKEHMTKEHQLSPNAQNSDELDWLDVAQKEGIFLECPLCSNTFQKEGFRSFTIHLVDDHGLSECESHEKFTECSKNRQDKTVQLIRERDDSAKCKKARKCRETLEAYVTSEGELRVRAIKKDVGANEDGADVTKKSEIKGN